MVEADSKARTELAALQRDLQQDQAEVGRQRDQLEGDRRDIAAQRHRDPLIAAAITNIGLILACLLPLVLCVVILRSLRNPVTDEEALAAFRELGHVEGILPALESAHAMAYVSKIAPSLPRDSILVANLSGRGDKAVEQAARYLLG